MSQTKIMENPNKMILDNYLDKKIGAKIVANNAERDAKHVSSGKLTASRLGEPLQVQILGVLGVKGKEIDEYTLRKFLRGVQIEDWLLTQIDTVDKQKLVQYRGVIGYADAICDTKDWENKLGILPLEVKSTSNAKFKRILKQGADRSHKLQAGLYALAQGTKYYGISYIATDDLRVQTYIYLTADIKPEIDQIIDRFEAQMKLQIIPKFVAIEKWQSNPEYQKYPQWSNREEVKFSEINK